MREAANVLAEAFTDEPLITHMIPLGTIHRQRKIADYFVWSMRLTGAETVDIAVDPFSDKILGVALWEGPGHVSRWLAGLAAKPGVLRGIGLRGLRVLEQHEAEGKGKRPETPHWHLVGIGTSSAARGLGVGAKLLEHRLSVIDSESCVASLEASSPQRASLYTKLGFEAKHDLTGIASGVCVMWRTPNPATDELAA